MAAFQPVRKLEGLEDFPEAERALLQQLNAIRLDFGRALGRPATTELKTRNYVAREEEYVRAAPATGGMTLTLPRATRENLCARVTVLLESVTNADLTVKAIGGSTINAATSLILGAVGRVDFISNGETGWFSERHVAGSTSIIESGGEWQRAALTGEVTAAQNSNATAIARSTAFAWTGTHTWAADIRLLTLHTEASVSGAFSITRAAGAQRVLITTTNDATLGTISGCADGLLLFVEHVEASGAPNTLTVTHDSSTANAFGCPGGVNLAIVSRGGFIAMGRGTNWKVVATTN